MSGIVRQDKLYIGGEWVDPIDGEVVPTIDPSTGEPWAEVAFGGPKDVDMLMSLEKITQGFAGLEPVLLLHIEREVVEGSHHTGLASVIQFIGRKPI